MGGDKQVPEAEECLVGNDQVVPPGDFSTDGIDTTRSLPRFESMERQWRRRILIDTESFQRDHQ